MEREKTVIDASVVVKWFVEEKYSKEARILMNLYKDGVIDLAAPSLLPYEVLNALKYSGYFGEDELKEVANIIDDFQFSLYPLTGDFSRLSVQIAFRKGVTIYDASYVALALLLNAPLFTADEKLLIKTRDTGVVKHLSEVSV